MNRNTTGVSSLDWRRRKLHFPSKSSPVQQGAVLGTARNWHLAAYIPAQKRGRGTLHPCLSKKQWRKIRQCLCPTKQ